MAIRVRHEPAAVGLALASDLTGRGSLAKERQKLLEQRRQYEEKLAEEQRQFDEGTRRFDVGQEFQEKQFGEGIRRFDLGYGLDVAKFGEGQRQFNVNQWLEGQRFLEGRRQYNLSLQEAYAKQAQDMQRAVMQEQGQNFRHISGQAGQDRRLGMINQQNIDAEMRQQANAQQNWQQQRIAGRMDADWQAIQNNRRFWTEDQYDNAVEGFQNKYANAGEPMPFDPPYAPPPGQAQLDEMLNSDDPALRQIGALSQLTPDGNSTMLIPGASEIFRTMRDDEAAARADEVREQQHIRDLEDKERERRYRYQDRSREYSERSRREIYGLDLQYQRDYPKPKDYANDMDPGAGSAAYAEAVQRHNNFYGSKRVEIQNGYIDDQVRDAQDFARNNPHLTFTDESALQRAKDSGELAQGEVFMLLVEASKVVGPGDDERWGTSDDDRVTVQVPRFGIVTGPNPTER
ncbi:MAG: hypothetical protein MK194_17905 [Roseibacillus sp.]|nr:hypothetical protein [Roseibacillus sp.]